MKFTGNNNNDNDNTMRSSGNGNGGSALQQTQDQQQQDQQGQAQREQEERYLSNDNIPSSIMDMLLDPYSHDFSRVAAAEQRMTALQILEEALAIIDEDDYDDDAEFGAHDGTFLLQ